MFFCLSAFLLSFSFTNIHAISAKSAIVIDAASGRVLYSHNSETKMGMASTTKIMTAITALENADISSIVTVSPTAYGVEGSSMYLGLGEKISLENLLYGLMLASGNDAATAVAEHVSGTTSDFALLMNETAKKIGAVNTSFTNPHGLSDPEHYTTAHDLAKITAYALNNQKFREIVSTYKKNIPWQDHEYDRYLVNHNKFLNMYDGCIGVKTGFTKATGRCLVTAVEKNGMTLVCVTLNAPDDWNDHKVLYDSVFSEYSACQLITAGETVAEAEIINGTSDTVGLTTEKDIVIPSKADEKELHTNIIPFENICAPITKGTPLGTFEIIVDNQKISEYPLVATENIEIRKPIPCSPDNHFLYRLKQVFFTWLTCFR